jgi:predicted permease
VSSGARPPRIVGLASALYRWTLRAHPRGFREQFGADMAETFEQAAGEAWHTRGAMGLLGLVARAFVDSAIHALTRRAELGRSRDGRAGAANVGTKRGGDGMMRTFVKDAALGARMLARRPAYSAVAIGTLALGIGANAAIFSVVNGVLLRSLPFPEPDQLVRAYHAERGAGEGGGSFSLVDRDDWASRTSSLSALAVYSTLPSGPLLTGGDDALELRTAYVSAGFFDALGREAYLGRTLLDEEERGDNRVVVLSHGFWERHYGADESVVGSTITLDDEGFVVVGVMPPDFTFPSPAVEAWAFLSIIDPSSIPLHLRQVRFLAAVGRLADGTSLEQAEAELSGIASALVEEYPETNRDIDAASLVPLRETITAGVRTTLLVLLGVVGLVLLIACANVANLLLSRGVERGRELGIRRALGASRGRLVRQLLAESLLLAGVGGALGVVLGLLGTEALLTRSGSILPRSGDVRLDGTVVLFALVVTVVTAFVFGLFPAIDVTRHGGTDRLSGAARQGGDTGARRPWSVLIAGQVALATVVVVASGLLLRSVWALQRVDIGLEAEGLVAISLTINDARYPERADYLGAYDRMMVGLSRLPGVESVASIRYVPLRRDGERQGFSLPEQADDPGSRPEARLLQISPGFFETAAVPLEAGRPFTDADGADAPGVVIVNDALRRHYLPGREAVGSMLGDLEARVVGVAGDVRQGTLAEEPEPTIYIPQEQNPRRGMAFLLRTERDPATLSGEIRAAIQAVDPDQPIDEITPMAEVVRSSASQPRFFSQLLAGFAALALLLSAVGIYGVVSHSVSRRVSEIGIRVALGAPRSGVMRMVMLGGMRPVVAGAVVGLVLASLTTRALRSMLFGVSATDPLTLAAVPVILVTVAVVACWAPASRALRIDPTEALRSE